jgi:hypothetical protein
VKLLVIEQCLAHRIETLPSLIHLPFATMFRSLGFAALSLLPLSLAQITNDFESGWDQTTWATYAPDCNQGGVVSLDTTKAHSGSNSIKVAGAGGYCGHAFFGTTKVPSGDVYVRTWL